MSSSRIWCTVLPSGLSNRAIIWLIHMMNIQHGTCLLWWKIIKLSVCNSKYIIFYPFYKQIEWSLQFPIGFFFGIKFTFYIHLLRKNFTFLCDLTSIGWAFTFSTKVEQISGYISTSWSNRGNLCLASMESSFMAFNKQTIIVSGKFFWLSLLRVKVSKSIKFWNEYMNKICVYIQ